ncbi:hypothetical protein XhhCFBP4925_22940, partial [Xanthomonas hortorum pv. hederae]
EEQWHANCIALQSGALLESRYLVSPDLSIRIVTDEKRHFTLIVLPS